MASLVNLLSRVLESSKADGFKGILATIGSLAVDKILDVTGANALSSEKKSLEEKSPLVDYVANLR